MLGSFRCHISGRLLLGLLPAPASPLLVDSDVKGRSVGRAELRLPPPSFIEQILPRNCADRTSLACLFCRRLKQETEKS